MNDTNNNLYLVPADQFESLQKQVEQLSKRLENFMTHLKSGDLDSLLSITDARRFLGNVSKPFFYKVTKSANILPIKLGQRLVRYRKRDLLVLLNDEKILGDRNKE